MSSAAIISHMESNLLILDSAKKHSKFYNETRKMAGYVKIQNVETGKFLTADYTQTDPSSSSPHNEFVSALEFDEPDDKYQKWRTFYEACTVDMKRKQGPGHLLYSINAVWKPLDGIRKGTEMMLEEVTQGPDSDTEEIVFRLKDVYKVAYLADTGSDGDGSVSFIDADKENQIGNPRSKLWRFIRVNVVPMETE